MDFIVVLLIIVLLWILLRPVFYVGRQVYQQYRMARKFQEQMRNGFGGFDNRQAEPQQRKGGWYASRRQRKKRIMPHEGEYIAFTEIILEITVSHDDAVFPTPEPRTIDITWIDL